MTAHGATFALQNKNTSITTRKRLLTDSFWAFSIKRWKNETSENEFPDIQKAHTIIKEKSPITTVKTAEK
jgi:hypothetical protein